MNSSKEEKDVYLKIEGVKKNSIAKELGLKEGDKILQINGQPLRDFISYKFLVTDTYLEMEVVKKTGERWVLEIEKDFDEELGIEFSEIVFDGLKTCNNKCLFCFIDQAPSAKEKRKSLYLKDDDYRFSFLEGSYITLTNLSANELSRIKRMRLSPLNISVHSMNPEIRCRLLNNERAGEIRSQIEELVGAGIELNTQIVLCPGINNGDDLENTIKELGEYTPQIKSLAVVPVGLTAYRENLPNLTPVTSEQAQEVISKVEKWQKYFRRQMGKSFVYLADEFYLLAGREVPLVENYDAFPQLENGVGMVRQFWNQFQEIENKLPTKLVSSRRVLLVTGELGEQVLTPIVSQINQIKNLEVELLAVENKYYGEPVTVTGLLTAGDIMRELKNSRYHEKDLVLIPDILLNEDDLFLDNISWGEFKEEVCVEIDRVGNDAKELVAKILAKDFSEIQEVDRECLDQ